jgi:hypothetical protein
VTSTRPLEHRTSGASHGPSSIRQSAERGDRVPRFCLGRRNRAGRVLALSRHQQIEKPAAQTRRFFSRRSQTNQRPVSTAPLPFMPHSAATASIHDETFLARITTIGKSGVFGQGGLQACIFYGRPRVIVDSTRYGRVRHGSWYFSLVVCWPMRHSHKRRHRPPRPHRRLLRPSRRHRMSRSAMSRL